MSVDSDLERAVRIRDDGPEQVAGRRAPVRVGADGGLFPNRVPQILFQFFRSLIVLEATEPADLLIALLGPPPIIAS